MMTGLHIRVPGIGMLHLPLPDTLLLGVFVHDDRRAERPFDALDVMIFPSGFIFELGDDDGTPLGYLRHTLNDFPDFLADLDKIGLNRSAIFSLPTAAAKHFIQLFDRWLTLEFAHRFVRDIRAGKMTFEDARNIRKEAFTVPFFQHFHAQSFASGNMPKVKKVRARRHDKKVEALYALSCRIYRETPKLSYERACEFAIEQRPDLVPPTWQEDPVATLKREAARYWDKSRYSQQTFRQNRDN